MAVYAIGDLQGCYDELRALLAKIGFSPDRDRLWFTGDLVNRGPKSLETLRFIRDLGDCALTVLGNHDLHLLAAAHDPTYARSKCTLRPVIEAPDRTELLDWLRRRPLLHHDETLGFTLIHAGLPPHWNLSRARAHAQEVEKALQGDRFEDYLEHMYGDEPARWSDELRGWDRLRYITNCFTRLRYCDLQGRLALQEKGPPGSQEAPYRPWFEIPNRASRDLRIVFGHWSTLGPRDDPGIYPLDTGCLWGGKLTALRLDGNPQRTALDCPEAMQPSHRKLST
jgi:bis(5'-nucleosyl)-tetraphosphatase (symmetrical)